MNNKHHFQLIDGTFAPSEAGRVLLALIERKIDHHSVEKFSNEERFGRDISHSEKRLHELATLKESLKDLLDAAEGMNQNLKIDGRIEIAFVPAPHPSVRKE